MTETHVESTALAEAAKKPQTPAIITTPAEYHESMQFWRSQHYNILTPFNQVLVNSKVKNLEIESSNTTLHRADATF